MSGATTVRVHRLEALDGQNPLAFLAALGTLRVLDDLARSTGSRAPRLRFVDLGRQVPELQTEHDTDRLLEILLEDARTRGGGRALDLAYDDDGNPAAPFAPGSKRDLKPSPAHAAEFLRMLSLAWREDRRAADLGHAFFSELVQDNNGNTKPTALHFAAGQQQWLAMVDELRRGLGIEQLYEALLGRWEERAAPSLAWDCTVARNYALRAVNPSTEKRGSIPGANWLAFIGLTCFPVEVEHHRARTTGVIGGWKTSRLTWPIWSAWVAHAVAAGILRGDVASLSQQERARMGIAQVYSSRIQRSEQGGYGSLSPAEIVTARPSARDTRSRI